MHIKKTGGFTLIEVLAAVLVLAVGVLGAAGAQVAALQTRHGTALMSGGVQLAGSLAERMRANPLHMHGPDARNPYLRLNYDALADGPPSPPATMCFGGAQCNSEQMAAFDLYEISAALHAGFPGGRVTVCRDAAAARAWACAGGAGAPIVIKLGWRSRGDPADTLFAPAVALVARGGAS